jgi:two-component system, LytTR family, response regulator LytT
MRVLIVEDEAPAARHMERLVAQLEPDWEVIGIASTIEQTVRALNKTPLPDLILCDIELTDGQSFEAFVQVSVQVPIIFTTAYNEFALKAFDYYGVAYLLKPISADALRKAFTKLDLFGAAKEYSNQHLFLDQLRALTKQEVSVFRERFLLRFGERFIHLETSQIPYFIVHESAVCAATAEGRKLPLDFTLDELEEQLNPAQFFRLNRSVIARHSAIVHIYAHLNGKLKIALSPTQKENVFVSRERASAFKKWMGE